MTEAERREYENWAQSTRLSDIDKGSDLRFLAGFIQDHEHLREKLLETSGKDRYFKFEAMRPYLRFRAYPLSWYELPSRGAANLTLG